MTQIFYDPSGGKKHEHVTLEIDDGNLTFKEIKQIAKKKALEKCSNPMFLSWLNGKTGEAYPKHECGNSDRPSWILYAESRGADLIIDINGGKYIFMILKI